MLRRSLPRFRGSSVPTVLALAVVATLVTGTAAAPAAVPCSTPPDVVPVDELTAGEIGTGITTLVGTSPVPFDFEVVGVIPDGWMLGVDAVVIQITGPASFLDRTGGVFFGMSGSPAYVGGRLAGAVSAGFFDDPTFGVLTPAEAMLRLVSDPGSASALAERIEPTSEIRRAIASSQGISATEVDGVFRRLPVMLGVSGLSAAAIDTLQGELDDRGENVQVYSAGPADIGGPVVDTPFQPGEPLGAALSYGDASLFATGTATFVCDDTVVAFGHSLFWEAPGAVSLGLAGATGLMVLHGSLWPGARWANLTEPRGTIVTDSLVGVAGIVGQEPPTVPIASDLTNADEGTSRQGETQGIYTEGYWLDYLVWSHVYANIAAVRGGFGAGTTGLEWTIDGERADGTPFTVANRAMVASQWDAAEVVYWLTSQIDVLQYNGFEDLDITGVSMTGSTTRDLLTAQIDGVRLASPLDRGLRPRRVVRAEPGDRVTIEVTLDPQVEGDEDVTVRFTVLVPRGASGESRMQLSGGTGWWPRHRFRSVDDLLEALNGGTHTDDLVLEGFATKVRRQDYVVVGRTRFTIDVVRGR